MKFKVWTSLWISETKDLILTHFFYFKLILGQALINRWGVVKHDAQNRLAQLRDKQQDGQNLLCDVEEAIEWLKTHNLFEKMHCLHSDEVNTMENETDNQKNLKKEIVMLKDIVSESKEKVNIIKMRSRL